MGNAGHRTGPDRAMSFSKTWNPGLCRTELPACPVLVDNATTVGGDVAEWSKALPC